MVVVGAGHGGANAAAFLRQQGFAGEVILLGEEPVVPYHRPPLSKKYVTGDVSAEDIHLKPARFYGDQEIELRLGCRVVGVAAGDKVISFDDGSTLGYDSLILATGAAPRVLDVPGSELEGVERLRTVADAGRLKELVKPGQKLAIVGGGYIGLEVAAACRTKGISVVIVERESRLLPRVAGTGLSEFLTRYHQEHGTEILVSGRVKGFGPNRRGSVGTVLLDDGTELPCDAALVGVGAIPRDELARAAGLSCDGGVVVDERSRTSDRSIYAVGDMTRRPLPGRPGLYRMESIPSAVEQAGQAVAAILARPGPKSEVPWFWSDQFDLKLKTAGLVGEGERVVCRSSADGNRAAFFHLRDEAVVAVEAINASTEFMAGRRFIENGTRVDPGKLADHSIPLREVGTAR
ncbi:FAD-dependent oxidoreductase [Amycolatopsis acidiphila]|uniref:NAD(P)/FAD-dependent oxidoreductase n=1 Tax=Amycolatopsis acidiphila TaxID=715473 RepID=UPI001C98651D|nr:FAD-dependent oxidoreductase [Amycolatopsis acidiphila]UIJ57681.1 FAD-dependent oxidoreductase [Amycolatopsis acidiphila]